MTGREEFFNGVEEGRRGRNIGLPIGSKKMELYMDGLLPGTSYLIGANSGIGKSTYALWAFIYNPLIAFLAGISLERDPYWILFSLEMTRSQIYAKLVSMYIFDKYGIELRFKEIFSRGEDSMLSDENYELLKECCDFLDILDKRLIFHEGTLTEKIYQDTINEDLERFGTFVGENEYIANNPQQVIGVLVDHMSLVKASNGRSKKDEMDAISRDSVMIRNITKIVSPILVAQFNRGSGSDERLKQDMQEPSQNDFKDTGSLYEDSQVVIALYSPHAYKKTTYKGYKIKDAFEQMFIGIFLLKTRFGSSQILVPTGFYGDCSHYADLPKPDRIYDYERYLTPNYLLKDDSSIEQDLDNIESIDESTSNLNFVL